MEIQVNNVYKTYDNHLFSPFVLKDVSFNVSSTESVLIEGGNGSGKTTLLNLLAGLDSPTEGEILFDGQDLFSLSVKEQAQFRKNNIGYVQQEPHLFDDLPVYKNLEIPLIINKYPRYMRRKTITEVSKRMGITDLFEQDIRYLNEKQKVKVSVARALMCFPKLLLVDEPDQHIDDYDETEINKLMIDMSLENNFSLIITTSKSATTFPATRYHLTDGYLVNTDKAFNP